MTSHYLNHCWPRLLPHQCLIRKPWVRKDWYIPLLCFIYHRNNSVLIHTPWVGNWVLKITRPSPYCQRNNVQAISPLPCLIHIDLHYYVIIFTDSIVICLKNVHRSNKHIYISVMKCVEVSPIFKKDENLLKGNSRPVSILACISKLYENVLNCTLIFQSYILGDFTYCPIVWHFWHFLICYYIFLYTF